MTRTHSTIRTLVAGAVTAAGLLTTAGAAQAAPDWPTDQTITATIVDARSHTPLAGVRVGVLSHATDEVYTATTDAAGKVTVAGMTGDEFEVITRSTRTHCGGRVWGDHADRLPVLDAVASTRDWNSWGAGDIGVVGLRTRSVFGTC
ncbi:MAG: hypothetical protein RIR49_437 [Actinomycetota bacterium]